MIILAFIIPVALVFALLIQWDWRSHPSRRKPISSVGSCRCRSPRPLHQNALDAALRGELRPLGRFPVRRPESDYAQQLPPPPHLRIVKVPYDQERT